MLKFKMVNEMKRVHFREVVKKLKELKQSGNKQALEQFRNTKISEINLE